MRVVLDRNVALARELVRREPRDPAALRRLAAALRYRAIVHRTNLRDPEARASITEAYGIAARLLERDPDDAGALRLFAAVAEVLAQVLGDAREFSRSYAMGAEVYAAQQRLVTLAGSAPGAVRSLATSTATRGANHYNGADYAGACHWWRNALSLFEGLDRRGMLSPTDRANGVRELRDYLARGCDGGPGPRRMAGEEP